MTSKLTVTEAETLAVMLGNAASKMAVTETRVPGTMEYRYAWPGRTGNDAAAEMFAGFYAIAPPGIYI